MVWKIKWEPIALKDLEKLDKQVEKRIFSYMEKRVAPRPFALGKALTGNMASYWRYRVQNYRIICRLENEELVVLVVKVGHRDKVYD